MADVKISNLPAADTPLAGTEQVPLVQDGVTKKATVSDIVAAATAGVTDVTASAPVVSSGGTTPNISMPSATASRDGYLTSTDWNTFNSKGSGTVTGVTATSPVQSSGGTAPVISMPAANGSTSGYLTSTDWNTFNNKQPAGSYLTNGGALGTPSSGTATNLTGLPLSTGVTGILPVANGGSGTATPSLVAGTNVTISGTWPNQTINATGGSGGGDVTGPASSTDNAIARFDGTTGKIIQNSGVQINDAGEVSVGVWKGTEIGISYGGTGASSASQARGNLLPSYTGNSGKVLAVNTGATDVEWVAAGGVGTVTSVDVSGGTTGLTTSGGPITGSGTITLAGTLAVANGGTGATTAGGARTNLGAAASGANSDITSLSGITGAIGTADYVAFDTTYTTPLTAGQLGWDGNNTLAIGMAGGNVTQHIGEDGFYYIKASSTITKGQVIMFAGAVGASGVPLGAPATGVTDGTYIMGVAAESIATNGFGLVQFQGTLRNVDTSAFADGDILWYNPAVTGALTKTKPSAPNVKVQMAAVINGGSSGGGTILIRVTPGSVLGGTDSNVQFSTLANNNLIQYDSALGYWKNVAPGAITGVGSVANALTIGTGLTGTSYNGSSAVTVAIDSTVATLSGTQTLTNKTISGASNTLTNIGNGSLTNSSVTVNGTSIALGASGTVTVPISTGVTGLGTGVATALAVNVGSAGAPVVNGGALGTPSSGTLTNATGLPISSGVSGLGTGIATALGTNVGSAGSVVVNGGALGTPSSGTLTNATGLPISSGVSGLGSGIATFLGTPSSANLAAAVTDETGSGALVFGTSPTLTNPTITNYTETAYSANSSTAISLSLTNGTVQIITLTGNATITMPTAGAGKSFIMYLRQDSTGSRTVTWSTVNWPGGTAPTITSTASKQDIYSFFSDGTSWYGVTVGQNYTQ